MQADFEDSRDDAWFASAYQGIAPALQAWARLRIQPQLRGYCEPEDLLQEIWCRAFAIRERFEPEQTSFRRWMFRIAKNVLLEVTRRARSQQRVANAEGRTSQALRRRETRLISRRASRAASRGDESLRAFHERVEALGEDERELFVHIGLEGLDYGEVAERLDASREGGQEALAAAPARTTRSARPSRLPRRLKLGVVASRAFVPASLAIE